MVSWSQKSISNRLKVCSSSDQIAKFFGVRFSFRTHFSFCWVFFSYLAKKLVNLKLFTSLGRCFCSASRSLATGHGPAASSGSPDNGYVMETKMIQNGDLKSIFVSWNSIKWMRKSQGFFQSDKLYGCSIVWVPVYWSQSTWVWWRVWKAFPMFHHFRHGVTSTDFWWPTGYRTNSRSGKTFFASAHWLWFIGDVWPRIVKWGSEQMILYDCFLIWLIIFVFWLCLHDWLWLWVILCF